MKIGDMNVCLRGGELGIHYMFGSHICRPGMVVTSILL